MISKRYSLISAAFLGVTLLSGIFWSRHTARPSLQLPEGTSIAEALRYGSLQTPKGWYTNQSLPRPPLVTPQNVSWQKIRWAIGFKLDEILGRIPLTMPTPPASLPMKGYLDGCSHYGGETYLLAKELLPTNPLPGWGPVLMLSYMYGGTNLALDKRHWITLNETAILKNGVILSRMREHPIPTPNGHGLFVTETYATNRCAIIRDEKRLVKIIPLEFLRAYSDAGLIQLPKTQ